MRSAGHPVTRALVVAWGVLLLSSGCSGGDRLLSVDLKTDYRPSLEFAQVRTQVAEPLDGGLPSSRSTDIGVSPDMDFLRGRRVAEFNLGSAGTYVVTVQLLADDGRVVAQRTVRATIDKRFGLTVVITHSCDMVTCPEPGGDTTLTECVGGRCVSPECSPLRPELCGTPECSSDSECTARVACAEASCVDSYCLQVPRADGCLEGEWCSVERGCLPLPGRECVPEAEICDGVDNDCDRSVDEDFDLDTDPMNCGSCGTVCGGAHATSACTGGSCGLTCDEGWADCNGDPSDGCEADLTSPGSCGDCSRTCVDPEPLCVRAGDVFSCASSCPPDAPTLCGGSCVDTDTSLAHCGGCGMGCDPAHATGECRGGTCAIASCDPGWDDCSGGVDDGCESDLTDPATCGRCDTACPPATPFCVPGGGGGMCSDGCSDRVRGGDETDVDCGGSLCGPCGPGRSCGSDSDCDTYLVCGPDGTCVACGECTPGATDARGCGMCGSQMRTCGMDCRWGAYSTCTGEGECGPGAVDSRGCGNCGTQTRTCSGSCMWGTWGTCIGEGECTAGATESRSCGMCGMETRTCSPTCGWGSYGACTGSGVCTPGAVQMEACGNCGMHSRTCNTSCAWGSYGTCSGEGVCSPGATRSVSCGNCGTATETCNSSCAWGSAGSCTGEGPCSPGSTTSSGCFNMCQRQTCNSSCQWPGTDGCTGCGCSTTSPCGSSCPSGYHVSARSCNFSCGSSCTTSNRVTCTPDCGTSFLACSSSCSTGYHVSARSCNFSCGSSCTTSNAVTCTLNAGSSFLVCGSSCPSNYHVSARSCNFSCGSSCTTSNAVTCGINSGSSFRVCGSSCPSGYYVSRIYCDFACGSSCTTSNAVTCTMM